MKLIKKNNADIQNRSDGRVVVYSTPIDIPKNTKNIGLISVKTPKGCDEVLHKHPDSTEIFFHFTEGQIMVNGKKYSLEKGDIVILEPGDEHKQIAENEIDIVALRIPLSNDKVIIGDS